jgi:LTXXQ motif family protein
MKSRWIGWMASGMIVSVASFATDARADTNSLTQFFPALTGVELTATQQTQLATLSQQTLPKLQSLLSPAQQTQFNATLASGQGVRAAALSLNLSVSQRLKILNLLQPLRSQVTTILTTEQQQQIQQNIKAMQQ